MKKILSNAIATFCAVTVIMAILASPIILDKLGDFLRHYDLIESIEMEEDVVDSGRAEGVDEGSEENLLPAPPPMVHVVDVYKEVHLYMGSGNKSNLVKLRLESDEVVSMTVIETTSDDEGIKTEAWKRTIDITDREGTEVVQVTGVPPKDLVD